MTMLTIRVQQHHIDEAARLMCNHRRSAADVCPITLAAREAGHARWRTYVRHFIIDHVKGHSVCLSEEAKRFAAAFDEYVCYGKPQPLPCTLMFEVP